MTKQNGFLPSQPDPGLAWHAGLLVGHPSIDAEHETFVRLIAALKRAPDDNLGGALDTLAAHAQQHFGSENASMAATGFPARACHADEHAAVLASMEGVRRRLAQGDVAVARRLCTELEAWFPAHAQHLDSALAHWLCKLRLGGQPIVLRRSPPIAS